MKLVIDTNVIIESITERSPYHPIFLSIKNHTHFLVISNEILSEYYEIFTIIYGDLILKDLSLFFEYSQNILLVEPHYRFNLIQADPDDNKFVDCAICGNADYIITSDQHFNVLNTIKFPKVEIITPKLFIHEYLT